MTKQLIALALAAAFGIAHAADTKHAPVKVAADTTTSQSKVGGPDAATGKSPEMKTDAATNSGDTATTKTHKKHHRKAMHKKGAAKADSAPAADTTK